MKAPSRFLEAVVALAIMAGEKIMAIYQSEFRVGKLADSTLITAANLVSHHFLSEALHALSGNFPVLSALSAQPAYEDLELWETYWLVNPLDGTLEFTRHSGEFTINIALIHQHRPVLGVVYAPATQTCYFAAEGCGSFKQVGKAEPQPIYARMQAPQHARVVCNRSPDSPGMNLFFERLGEHEFTAIGSALNFCQVAEGCADIFPSIGLSYEWDTAAAQCIVESAGGAITDLQGKPLLYNAKPSLVNPFILAYGDKTVDWTQFAEGVTGSPRSAPPPPTPLLKAVVALVLEAGKRVLEIYATDFRIGSKADRSPLTAGDLVSHHYLSEALEKLPEHFPVLSGESAPVPFDERSEWESYWLVDPLNGTNEFIQSNGEFTINVALIRRNQPVLGVVYAPALDTCYFAAEDCAVFKAIGQAPPMEIHARLRARQYPIVLGGRTEQTPELDDYLSRLGVHEFRTLGSSLKFCRIAEGAADLYPCFASSCEWDTAAAQYIVESAGGKVVDLHGEPLRYNAKAALVNPYFLVFGDASCDWKAHALQLEALENLMAA